MKLSDLLRVLGPRYLLTDTPTGKSLSLLQAMANFDPRPLFRSMGILADLIGAPDLHFSAQASHYVVHQKRASKLSTRVCRIHIPGPPIAPIRLWWKRSEPPTSGSRRCTKNPQTAPSVIWWHICAASNPSPNGPLVPVLVRGVLRTISPRN